MSKVIEIPGGQATLRDVKELPVRLSRAISRAEMHAAAIANRMPKDLVDRAREDANVDREELGMEILRRGYDVSQGDLDAVWDLQDAKILGLLESWTLVEPVPTTKEALQELPENLYTALADGVEEQGRLDNFEPTPDQSRPTGPSSA